MLRPTMMFLAVVTAGATLLACGSDKGAGPSGDSLVRILFSSAQAGCSGFEPGTLTVTELWGPRGATLSNTIPGEYMAKGSYNLPPSGGWANVKIDLGFEGSVVIGQGGESVPQVDFRVPAGSLTGSYEVRGGFLSRTNGTGRPGVFMSSGSSVLECLTLF